MRWRVKDPNHWHKAFAFLPLRIENAWIWLRLYNRRWVTFAMCPERGHWEREVISRMRLSKRKARA